MHCCRQRKQESLAFKCVLWKKLQQQYENHHQKDKNISGKHEKSSKSSKKNRKNHLQKTNINRLKTLSTKPCPTAG